VISIFSNIDSLNLEILKIINNLDVQEQYKINFINSGNFKKKMTKASKVKSEACIIVGEEEWKTKKIIWKDFNSGEQETLSIENLKDFINKKIIKK
jgi:histidyl-tRNA synthetase